MVAAPRFLPLACALLVAVGLAIPTSAVADDGPHKDVRARGSCTGSNESRLRVRAEDGRLRIEFRIDADRRYRAWAIVLLRERRIVFRGTLTPGGGGRALELRRTIADWPGTNTVAVRASTRTGQSCRATATV